MAKNIKKILKLQKNELAEYLIYLKLAEKAVKNKKILKEIALQEKKHFELLKKITKQDTKPNKFKVGLYIFLIKIFGVIFVLKLMEKGEGIAPKKYDILKKQYSDLKLIEKEEYGHEEKLISMLKDEKLEFLSSIVLGLNDALVEISGTLVGLVFVSDNIKNVGIIGIIMGVAAALSMAGSSYLSMRESVENQFLSPLKSALYTGISYIMTVVLLVLPYFIFTNKFIALFFMFLVVLIIIVLYNFYVSIVQNKSFRKIFFQMLTISLGVSIISFFIGFFVKRIFGVDI